MGQLEKFGKDSHQNARTDEQHQHGNPPYEAVNGAVHICDHFYHNTFPPHFLHVCFLHSPKGKKAQTSELNVYVDGYGTLFHIVKIPTVFKYTIRHSIWQEKIVYMDNGLIEKNPEKGGCQVKFPLLGIYYEKVLN